MFCHNKHKKHHLDQEAQNYQLLGTLLICSYAHKVLYGAILRVLVAIIFRPGKPITVLYPIAWADQRGLLGDKENITG